ncbi:hypothetical protein HO173_009131 [Letharia columbiana]|uniref:Spindle pole body component n=1 Tax=Letharia columbiana TaxID=112416 RepID=A0A8H6FQ89_9LECA|nr:uncharacterized protein HO173_009131 [Letharia columbiana]KAF6232692.1 hypothetical protein HO173_009131 [Letharia columbiana]
MLHEILLALGSGSPSPLLYPQSHKAGAGHGLLQSFLSPAEQALLQSLAHNLGDRNRNIRDNASAISSIHPSTVCRAVSTAIISIYLANFQQKILEVEQEILREDARIVGAHNIVPLSAIVGAFDGWSRKLEWLWKLVQYIQAPAPGEAQHTRSKHESRTAAELIGHLRESTHTGYPDIEAISLDLVRVAETAWLKQTSAWVLYGRHPAYGAGDFFIARHAASMSQTELPWEYCVQDSLVPCFVTPHTAHSILFIGRSLNHIRERQSSFSDGSSKAAAPELALLSNHLAHLSSLEFPLSSSSFSTAIGAIRLSLSQNALQKLLPLTKVLEMLQILKEFFLLERGEFAVALLTAADERLTSRNQAVRSKQNLVNELASMTIKEGEVSAVLARAWTALASYQSLDDEDVDEELDQARELIRLSIRTVDADHTSKPSLASFNDLLLPAPTILTLRVPSPLDLFLSASDVDTYSHIHAYLLSIRRAHLRLSKLFLLSVLRRDHPCPKAPESLEHHHAFDVIARMRTRAGYRGRILRPIWATIASAAFFLAELGEFFQGEVVRSSWSTFHRWLMPTLPHDLRSVNDSFMSSIGSSGRSRSPRPTSSQPVPEPAARSFQDPETLTQAHKRYLASLEKALLLHDPTFTTALRRFMTSIDHMSALMQRLDTIQRNMDSDTQNEVSIATNYFAAEEERLVLDLKASRAKVASGVQALIEALRAIDVARSAERNYRGDQGLMQHDGFVPWTGGDVDRLLLKLDYGNVQNLA